MNQLAALNKMLETSQMTRYGLSKQLGKSPAYVTAIYQRGSGMSVNTLASVADKLGYELILKGHGEEIVIDPSE